MQLITYKTNIRNEAALNKIASFLDKAVGPANWQIDMNRHAITVFAPGVVDEDQVLKIIRKAGFKAENMEDYLAIY